MRGIVVAETRKPPTLSSVTFLTEKKKLSCLQVMRAHTRVVILIKRY